VLRIADAPQSRRRQQPDDTCRGAAAVEAAIVLPVLAILTFGVVDFSLAYSYQVNLRSAVANAASFASVQPAAFASSSSGDACANGNSVTARFLKEAPNASQATVTEEVVQLPDGTATNTPVVGCNAQTVPPGSLVVITATTQYHFVTNYILHAFGGGLSSMTVGASTTVQVQG
jgi:Flp pilus assembly protein TadG